VLTKLANLCVQGQRLLRGGLLNILHDQFHASYLRVVLNNDMSFSGIAINTDRSTTVL
jgi:hypothetical protein